MSDLEPFAVEVQRRKGVTIVQPRGELGLATAAMLRSTLDAAIAETLSTALDGMEHGARLVLDLHAACPSSTPPVCTWWRSTSARSATDSS